MSSLAAARADNFYNPPDWDPSKESRNKYHGSHGALGDRARKLEKEGILIIRFEMPFNVWCQGCSHLIGKGVRFNAKKKKIGKYHSTTIWSFVMKAQCCKQKIEIHTDPRNAEYVIVTGARRKAEPKSEDLEGLVSVDPRAEDRPSDAMGKLEMAETDKRRVTDRYAEITELREQSYDRYKNDADRNGDLRRAMRAARKEEQKRAARRDELGLPKHVTLLPETRMDQLRSSAVDFGSGRASLSHRQKRKSIRNSGIFDTPQSNNNNNAAGRTRTRAGRQSSILSNVRKRKMFTF